MTRNTFLVICALLFFCCQQATDINDFPENGKASVNIENVQYSGSAYLSSRRLGDLDFESVVIELDDSTKINIICERFEVGIFSCRPSGIMNEIIFHLTYNQKPFYSMSGVLNLKKVDSEQIIGEFDIMVIDATSSCSNCPEDMKKIVGKFNAIKL